MTRTRNFGFNGALESGLSASRIGVRDMLSYQ